MPYTIDISGDFYTTADGFGYDKYANTIISMITDAKFPSPFTFGIFGEWGSGKTSLMRMIEETLQYNHSEKLIPVWFNPWRYEKEKHLIIPFLKTIQLSLSKHIEINNSISKKVKEKLNHWITRVANASFAIAYGLQGEFDLKVLKFKMDISKAADREEKLNERMIKEPENFSSMYYDILSSLKEISEEEPNDLRVAVFIDDLDRCLPEKAIEMLESIKLFLEIPGYIFFIGVDNKVIEKGVKVKYKGYIIEEKVSRENTEQEILEKSLPITPTDYLEKMIQLPIYLPPIEKSRINAYIKTLIGENTHLKPYLDIIERGLKSNPRTYKRFINTLAFHTKLAKEKGILEENTSEANSADVQLSRAEEPKMRLELLTKWTLINFAYQDLVEAIKKRKLLLTELQGFIESMDKEEKEIEYSISPEESHPKIEVPIYLRHWAADDKLKHILRIDVDRRDVGFSKDNIDLYLQMGEFSFTTEGTATGKIKLPSLEVEGKGYATEPIGKMIKIPKGEFLYGDKNEKRNIDSDYQIGAYPVTNAEYKEFLGEMLKDNPEYNIPRHWIKGKDGNVTFPEDKENHPVVYVSYDDAIAYCEWKSETGLKYRLPTEYEWEKAARGTDGRIYPWGDEFDEKKCNYRESRIGETAPVDKYPGGVSPYGCYDMSGNVWEWTDSWYDKAEKDRVHRGGSVMGDTWFAQYPAYRNRDAQATRSDRVGFRVVLSA